MSLPALKCSQVRRIIKCAAFLIWSTALLEAQDGEIRGSVIDLFNGRPVVLSTVDLSGKPGQIERGGAYRFSKVPPGEYELTIKASSFYDVTIKHVRVANAQTLMMPTVQLESIPFFCPGPKILADYYELDGSTALSATILGKKQAPVENATVRLYAKRVGKIAEMRTNDKGLVSFSALDPSRDYWISVSAEGYFTDELAGMCVQLGLNAFHSLNLEQCQMGHCQPGLKTIRVNGTCE